MTLEKLAKQIFDECAKEVELMIVEEAQEMAKMEINAKGIKIGARATEPKAEKEKRPKVVQVSQEKQENIQQICKFVTKKDDFTIQKENKLVLIHKNGKEIKLDFVETRQKKG